MNEMYEEALVETGTNKSLYEHFATFFLVEVKCILYVPTNGSVMIRRNKNTFSVISVFPVTVGSSVIVTVD